MASCSDDVIWDVINRQFCTYKVITANGDVFCRHEYNVSGVCSRITCPLANSQYATVRSIDGKNYLCIKTPERQHLPNKWWEKIQLSDNYDEAIKQIDEYLPYWPDRYVDRCKQRLSRLFEVKITQRRLALTQDERHYEVRSSKVKRREQSRERKALVAAKLERAIERELLDRLKSGAYGEQPLNVDESVWQKVMSGIRGQDQVEEQIEQERVEEDGLEFVEDDEDDDDELVDVEDMEKWLDASDSDNSASEQSDSNSDSDSDSDNTKKSKKVPRKRVKASKPPKSKAAKRGNYEYEQEHETESRTA